MATLQQRAENRVHFDLNALKKTMGSTNTSSSNVTVVEGLRSSPKAAPMMGSGNASSQLPSDTRQRLEEMAASGSVSSAVRRYNSNNTAGNPRMNGRSSSTEGRLDPVQETAAGHRYGQHLTTSAHHHQAGRGSSQAVANKLARRESVPLSSGSSVPSSSPGQQQQQGGHAPTNISSSRERSLNLKNDHHHHHSAPITTQSGTVSPTNTNTVGGNMGGSSSYDLNHLDASKKVRPRSFWANWWRF